MKRKPIASEMVFLLKYRKMPTFRGAYIRRGLCTEGNWPLKIDWPSLILGWVDGRGGFNEKPKKGIHILTGPGSGAGL